MNLVSELDLPEFDYTSPGFSGDEYHEQLAEARRLGWLARSPIAYLVLEREPGEFFLRSRATAFPGRQLAEFFGVTAGPLADHIAANILNLTGDQHRRLRGLVGPAFGPRSADRWRPAMREFLRALWPVRAGNCEFVSAVAKPYSSRVIAAVLGAPLEDAPRLHDWSGWVQKQFDIRAMETSIADIERAVADVQAYVTALLDEPADGAGDRKPADLISELLAAQSGGDRLTHAECVSLVVNLIAGGIDTTQSQLAQAIRLFAAHPAQWELLATRPGLVPRAVSEVLRFEPVTPFTARICLEELTCNDVIFPAGTIVAICAERGNRETADGERFDITAERDDRLLTFGAGPHYCLGSSLARAELEEALAFLAPRTPGLALDGEPSLGGVEGIYGVEKLPIRWQGASTRASPVS
jgi:cytochrome P450